MILLITVILCILIILQFVYIFNNIKGVSIKRKIKGSCISIIGYICLFIYCIKYYITVNINNINGLKFYFSKWIILLILYAILQIIFINYITSNKK